MKKIINLAGIVLMSTIIFYPLLGHFWRTLVAVTIATTVTFFVGKLFGKRSARL